MASYECPHCNETIDHVNYLVRMTEYGTAYIGGNSFRDFEYNDSRYDDDYEFECPECNHELLFGDLIVHGDDEDDEAPRMNIPISNENIQVQ